MFSWIHLRHRPIRIVWYIRMKYAGDPHTYTFSLMVITDITQLKSGTDIFYMKYKITFVSSFFSLLLKSKFIFACSKMSSIYRAKHVPFRQHNIVDWGELRSCPHLYRCIAINYEHNELNESNSLADGANIFWSEFFVNLFVFFFRSFWMISICISKYIFFCCWKLFSDIEKNSAIDLLHVKSNWNFALTTDHSKYISWSNSIFRWPFEKWFKCYGLQLILKYVRLGIKCLLFKFIDNRRKIAIHQ